jgi:hypothetical protein
MQRMQATLYSNDNETMYDYQGVTSPYAQRCPSH